MKHDLLSTEEAKNINLDDIWEKLSSGPKGISSSEAEKRLKKYGPNQITEKRINPLLKFLSYFWGPIPWMIEAAALLSAVIKRWEDFGIILTLLLFNAIVGFWQEHKADNAIESLKQKLAVEAETLRDGQWRRLAAKDLVPGDVVRLRSGDRVPADLKLAEGAYLTIDESSLTGESMPVEKYINNIAFAGSIISQGEMKALVVSTGMRTYFGKTARLVEEAKTESHFKKAVVKIGDYLIFLAMALVLTIFVVALFRGESLAETLQFALVLTVAAIPVALPAVLSVTLAVGAMALAKKEAIVSKLVAIEEMAGVDVLCSDKTGTITQNKLSVSEVMSFEGFSREDVLLLGALASEEVSNDAIDKAVMAEAEKNGISTALGNYQKTSFKPFDPVSKYTEADIKDDKGKEFKAAKGAPQSILFLIPDKKELREKVEEKVNIFAGRGDRPLGVARTDKKGTWRYAGMIGLKDPPREDSADTIKKAQAMGVKVKMVTGDHAAIAKEISKQVHLGTTIIQASSFMNKSDRDARVIVEKADGFAQVFPEHKYHIVELLQERDHIVGMTGDGVNDAPALKKADVGIAVAGATDAAKSAAAIVLTKSGLSVIIDTIQQSRRIFQRMTNYSLYRIAETIRVLIFITLSIIIFHFYPVTALMIVLLALLNDAPIMTIAYDNVKYSDYPEKWNMKTLLSLATILGILGVLITFLILFIGRDMFHLSRGALQSFIYLKLSVAGHLMVFVTRTKGHFWEVKPAKPLFFAVIITQIIATLIVVYGFLLPPIGWGLALFVWGYALIAFIITDFIKIHLYKLLDHKSIRFHR